MHGDIITVIRSEYIDSDVISYKSNSHDSTSKNLVREYERKGFSILDVNSTNKNGVIETIFTMFRDENDNDKELLHD